MKARNSWIGILTGVILVAAGCASGGSNGGGGAKPNGAGANEGGGGVRSAGSSASVAYEELGGSKARAGFAVYEVDGKTWVFRRDSKDHTAFKSHGPSDKHSTKFANGMAVKGPDLDTINAYLAAKPGFAVDVTEGRLWVYRAGSKEWMDHQKNGPSDKHVTIFHEGRALKGPDVETLRAYVAAP